MSFPNKKLRRFSRNPWCSCRCLHTTLKRQEWVWTRRLDDSNFYKRKMVFRSLVKEACHRSQTTGQKAACWLHQSIHPRNLMKYLTVGPTQCSHDEGLTEPIKSLGTLMVERKLASNRVCVFMLSVSVLPGMPLFLLQPEVLPAHPLLSEFSFTLSQTSSQEAVTKDPPPPPPLVLWSWSYILFCLFICLYVCLFHQNPA